MLPKIYNKGFLNGSIATRYIYIQGHVILAWIDNKKMYMKQTSKVKAHVSCVVFSCAQPLENVSCYLSTYVDKLFMQEEISPEKLPIID